MLLDQSQRGRPARPPAGPDVARGRLHLLDVHVGVEGERKEVVGIGLFEESWNMFKAAWLSVGIAIAALPT